MLEKEMVERLADKDAEIAALQALAKPLSNHSTSQHELNLRHSGSQERPRRQVEITKPEYLNLELEEEV